MKIAALSERNTKEIIRDPLNLFFGLGFPLIVLILLNIIQRNAPVSLFELDSVTPGICVFGLSFMTLFSATLISKDRESSFLKRLYSTPVKSCDFIISYALPIIPLALLQSVICYTCAIVLGLKVTVGILYSVIFIIPVSLLYISLGLLCGSIFTVKQVGGICGALLTNLSAWLSGVWFDISMLGGAIGKIANFLPFVHAVELERILLKGSFDGILPHLAWVLGYTVIISALAVWAYMRQMKRG